MTHTHHASARLKPASQLLCYSASLGCTNDPHPFRNLGVSLCMHWVDDEVDDGDKLWLCWLTTIRNVFARAYAPGHPYCRVIFGPSPSTRTLPRRVGPSHSPAEEFDGIASATVNPSAAGPETTAGIPVHLISHSSLQAPRLVHGSPLSISRRLRLPCNLKRACQARQASSVAAAAAETTGQPELDISPSSNT